MLAVIREGEARIPSCTYADLVYAHLDFLLNTMCSPSPHLKRNTLENIQRRAIEMVKTMAASILWFFILEK